MSHWRPKKWEDRQGQIDFITSDRPNGVQPEGAVLIKFSSH